MLFVSGVCGWEAEARRSGSSSRYAHAESGPQLGELLLPGPVVIISAARPHLGVEVVQDRPVDVLDLPEIDPEREQLGNPHGAYDLIQRLEIARVLPKLESAPLDPVAEQLAQPLLVQGDASALHFGEKALDSIRIKPVR